MSKLSRRKLLRFPNGQEIRSDRISHVNVFPDLSPTPMVPYVQVFRTQDDLVFEGMVDLDHVFVEDTPAVMLQVSEFLRSLPVATD